MTDPNAAPKVLTGHCPQCGPERKADVIGFKRVNHSTPDYWETDQYAVLECRGCGALYVRRDWDGEELHGQGPDVTFWPTPRKRPFPNWMVRIAVFDLDLHSLLRDIYTALDHGLLVLAAIGVRTIFDTASVLLGVDTDKSFKAKLLELHAQGKISLEDQNILGTLTDAGSAAAHRGWKPSQKQLEEMIEVIEHFLYQQIVAPGSAKKLKLIVPPRTGNSGDQTS